MVKGYKALGGDMKTIYGDGMTYEMNRNYTMNKNDVIPGKRGYHFFDNIRDIFLLFYGKKYDIYEIEADDYVEKIGHYYYSGKYVTNNIKVVRKLSEEEIDKYIKDNLDDLVNDEDYDVRSEVARQGYGLDILVNDDDWVVRREVAKQGYGLDILINDKDYDVRKEVAKQGYGLDKLVNDNNWAVRTEVARQGYGLDILVNDKDEDVRKEAAQMLKEKTK